MGLKGAYTHEIDPSAEHLVINVMEEQIAKIEGKHYGGTMRLGSYPCKLAPNTLAQQAYSGREKTKNKKQFTKIIDERHRHRYEVNPNYIEQLEKGGLIFSGKSPDGVLMEIAELPKNKHPFFLGTQFHPEFLARPLSPHPLFDAFIAAAVK